ncbi:MAG: DUF4339 domain-containing protein, partial [Verrucomicrobia bacterium]|nr:DUF4339 domain-containing protein [Verrucomicrobiota bacterium]
MNDRWIHVAREGEKLGKFGLSDIPALVDARLLKPSDDYWEPGMPEWHPLSELPELRAVGARSEDWKGEAKDAIAGATGLLARG